MSYKMKYKNYSCEPIPDFYNNNNCVIYPAEFPCDYIRPFEVKKGSQGRGGVNSDIAENL
jgi:hypothetical protein